MRCIVFRTGVAGVGKSTFFKQLKLIYTDGFSDTERKETHLVVMQQMLRVMNRILRYGALEANLEITEEIETLSEILVCRHVCRISNLGFLMRLAMIFPFYLLGGCWRRHRCR